ncbi:MAG: 50S ribosomal protein L20 [Candidatus Omnitrophica bacterium]|nr:50S ribosomal protein L20 [Candidatus Omnitrophota bacterium]MDD5672250.1 50S ribosomal protein L20 [Candidatus Omnitrophota bacterium]
MPRVAHVPAGRKRRKKFLRRAKGFVGGRRKLYRSARETVQRAMVYATRDRKDRKAEFRRLWTARINAACRQVGISYSRFVAGMKKLNVRLDRKSLADLAVKDFEAFQKVAEFVKSVLK